MGSNIIHSYHHHPCSKIADTVAGMKRGYPGLDLSECACCLR